MSLENLILDIEKKSGWKLDRKPVKRAYNQYVRAYKNLGNSPEKAHDKAVFIIDYYSH